MNSNLINPHGTDSRVEATLSTMHHASLWWGGALLLSLALAWLWGKLVAHRRAGNQSPGSTMQSIPLDLNATSMEKAKTCIRAAAIILCEEDGKLDRELMQIAFLSCMAEFNSEQGHEIVRPLKKGA